MRKAICLLLFIGMISILTAQVQYISVEVDTAQTFPVSVSIQSARIQTLQFARQCALEKALPRDISLSSLTTNMYVERNAQFDESTAVSIFMMSTSSGRIIQEEIRSETPVFQSKSQVFRYQICYRANILPLGAIYNPSLDLKIDLSECTLRDQEEFDLSVTSNTDGYLYIFDFLPDNSVAMVFPTLLMPVNQVKKGEAWQQKLTAVIAPEMDHSIETLYFVFSQEAIAGWEDFRSNRSAQDLVFSAGEESFTLFQNWLGKSDPAKRVEKMAQLHIIK